MGRAIHRDRSDRRRRIQIEVQEDWGRRTKPLERGATSAFLRVEVKIELYM
jgi:hypothetical protein